jgi:hypothetical protein
MIELGVAAEASPGAAKTVIKGCLFLSGVLPSPKRFKNNKLGFVPIVELAADSMINCDQLKYIATLNRVCENMSLIYTLPAAGFQPD